MTAGSIVRFDEVRGYGFIAPEGGGEDVFVHANDLLAEKSLFKVGARVEFEISEGDRGLKASTVRLAERFQPSIGRPVSADVAVADDGLCDVLSSSEFTQEMTEALLRVPSLTGEQILQLRGNLLNLARNHGWVDS